jgi:hypothetical protein
MAVPREALPGTAKYRWRVPDQRERQTGLVAETGAYSNAFATDGTATAQYGCASLGLHARAETMGFHTTATIGLKCALGQKNALLFLKKICALTASI